MTLKKIYSLFALAVVAAGLAACSDDDAGSEYLHKSQIGITSSTVTFTAKADTGSVTFNAPAGAQATAILNSSWAEATVDGNVVRVAVKKNPNLEGRSALLTIKAGEDSTNVTIQQQGMAYKYTGGKYFIYSDTARTVTLPLVNEGGDPYAETPEGVAATVTDSTMTLALSENTTGAIRTNVIYLHDGPYTDTIQVVQGELKDIINHDYTFTAYDLWQNKNSHNIEDFKVSYDVKVLADTIPYGGKTYVIPYIYFPSENWVLQFELDEPDLISIVPGGTPMGRYSDRYYLYSAIVDPKVFNALAQSNDAYPALLASDYMAMLAYWGSTAELGNVSIFDAYSKNLDNWIGQLFQGIDSYEGVILGQFVFSSKMKDWLNEEGQLDQQGFTNNLNSYIGVNHMFAYPEMVQNNVPAGAKRAVLPIGRRNGNAAQTQSDLQKAMSYIQAAKAAKASKSTKGSMKLNTSARFSSPSVYDYLRMLNVSPRK